MKKDLVTIWIPGDVSCVSIPPDEIERHPFQVEVVRIPTPEMLVENLSAFPRDVLCIADGYPFDNTRLVLRLTDEMPNRPVIVSVAPAIDVATAVDLMENGVFTIVSGESGFRNISTAINRAIENRRAFQKIIRMSRSLERSKGSLEKRTMELFAEKRKLRRKVSEVVLMRQVAELLGRSRSHEEGLSSVAPLLGTFVGAAHGAFIVSPDKDRWLECNTGLPGASYLPFPRMANYFRHAMPAILSPDTLRLLLPEEASEAAPNAIAFPVRVRQRFFGYGIFWGPELPAPTRDTLQVLETVGVQMGVFCQSISLQEQVETERDRLALANEELDFLFRLASFLHEDPDLDTVFTRLAGEIGRFVPCTGLEMVSLVGSPSLRTTELSGRQGPMSVSSYAESWADYLHTNFRISVPSEDLKVRALPYLCPASDGEAWDAESVSGKRWESVLSFGKERMGMLAVHMPVGALAGNGQEKVLKAVSAQLSLFLHNVSERNKVQDMATHDFLTGLLNFRSFQDHFEREFERYLRYSRNLTVMMIDLDNFKHVNDTYGHQVGDQVLKVVGDVITRSLRKTDYAFRYGGDEFVILMPDRSIMQAEFCAQRIRTLVRQEIDGVPPFDFSLSLSVGIADCTVLGSKEKEELLLRADGALYMAKSLGRDRVQVADRSMRADRAMGELCATEV